MLSDSTLALRLSALYAATFFGIGVATPFLPVWYGALGLGPDAIALLVAAPLAVRIVASAWTAGLADARAPAGAVLVVANALVALGYLLAAPGWPFWPLLALVVLIAAAQSPIVPLSDVLSIEAAKARPRLHYGRIRVWGSVSFTVATVAAGAALGSAGAGAVPLLMAASYGVAALVAWWAVGRGEARARREATSPSGRPAIPAALALVIAAAALINASHAVLNAFGSIVFVGAGYSATGIGLLWAGSVLSEIALFWLLGRAVGGGLSPFVFLSVGAGGAALRWVGMGLTADPILMAALQVLHGASFGATHLGTIGAFAMLAPERAKARLQGLLVAVISLTSAAVTAASGPLYAALGGRAFLAMAPVALAGLACAALAWRRARRQPQSAAEGGNTSPPS